MGFVTAIKVCFQKNIDFSGPAPGSEFWWMLKRLDSGENRYGPKPIRGYQNLVKVFE